MHHQFKNKAERRRSQAVRVLLVLMAMILAPFQPTSAGGAPESSTAKDVNPASLIRSRDVLRVTTWKEPDMTGDHVVRPDGTITVPIIGEVRAQGLSPSQLAADLSERLGRFLEMPQVTVAVSQSAPQEFFVLGQVAKTGAYTLLPNLTVVRGLALAGGFTPFAKRSRVVILRQEGADRRILKLDFTKLERGQDINADIELQPNDTIVVP